MVIKFKTKPLEKCYRDVKKAERTFGQRVAKRYIQRIDIIESAKDIDQLQQQRTLRCHPLKGSRAGQWAINLTGFYRLIFTLHGEALEIVRIEEVSKHYDD